MANSRILEMTGDVWGDLKDQKISLGLVAALAYMLWIGYGWVDSTFVTKVQADTAINSAQIQSAEDVAAIQKSVADLSGLLREHISDYSISEAVQNVEQIDSDLWHLKMHESQSGETAETMQLKRELDERRRHAILYRDCLLDNRPNCSHLERR